MGCALKHTTGGKKRTLKRKTGKRVKKTAKKATRKTAKKGKKTIKRKTFFARLFRL